MYASFDIGITEDIILQNENVGRAATSERLVLDIRRKDRRTPMKVLVGKTFHFVDHIWMAIVRSLCQHTGYTWLSSYCSLTVSQQILVFNVNTDTYKKKHICMVIG